jgi:hypothetical protein
MRLILIFFEKNQYQSHLYPFSVSETTASILTIIHLQFKKIPLNISPKGKILRGLTKKLIYKIKT